jgi:hypothetical protein
MEMGNLGYPRKKGNVQRGGRDMRDGDEDSSGILYYSDVYRRTGPKSRKRGVDRWLATSMFISFPPMSEERETKVMNESMESVKMTLDAISGSKSFVDVTAPTSKDPVWTIEARVQINGLMQEFSQSSIDLNDALSQTMFWANGINKC